MTAAALAARLDDLLGSRLVADASQNGLQVEAAPAAEITRIAYAVDASLATFAAAAAGGAGLLVTHHGLFWGRPELPVGAHGRRLADLFARRLSLYAAHLPLDAHRGLGHNIALVETAGFTPDGWFAAENGTGIGCLGSAPAGLPWEVVLGRLRAELGTDPVAVLPEGFTPGTVRRIGAVSGGGLRYAAEAAALGCDLFITGETGHAWFHPAREAGIPCLCYGHYASETPGLKRLAAFVEREWGLPGFFVDLPTGM